MAAQVQAVVPTAGSMLRPVAAHEQTVPLLLRLELGRQQLAELSDNAFALIAAESARKQQQLLQEAAAAAAASGCSSSGSSAADETSRHALPVQSADKAPAKNANSSATLLDAQSAAAAPGSSDVAIPAAAAPLKPIAYHVEAQGPDGKVAQQPASVQPATRCRVVKVAWFSRVQHNV
jgi:hypothetical protein